MTGSAEIITNDRRLIQRFFDNLKYIIKSNDHVPVLKIYGYGQIRKKSQFLIPKAKALGWINFSHDPH